MLVLEWDKPPKTKAKETRRFAFALATRNKDKVTSDKVHQQTEESQSRHR